MRSRSEAVLVVGRVEGGYVARCATLPGVRCGPCGMWRLAGGVMCVSRGVGDVGGGWVSVCCACGPLCVLVCGWGAVGTGEVRGRLRSGTVPGG